MIYINSLQGTELPLIVIVGPTATGKTEVSVIVAQNTGAEIISADSMLIYRHMNIGTAKPTPGERGGVPHHMIDVADPDEQFNVSTYSECVSQILEDMTYRKKLPIIVGGTGLYVKAVVDGYSFSEAGTDPDLRKKLLKDCETLGRGALHDRLRAVDPLSAARLHVNDVKRVIRALEVYYLSGKTITGSSGMSTPSAKKNLLMFGLEMERAALYSRIEKRVDIMIENGLVEEVRSLLKKGCTEESPSMQGLGYKEIILYLKGSISLEEAIELLKRRTRNFAKRQFTWFRRDQRIKWIDVNGKSPFDIATEITSAAEGVFQTASNEFK